MIRVKEIIIVEGKYDKVKLSSLIDGVILTTEGFGIFKDKAMLRTLRRLAEERGLVILTDSDRAGFKIRHYLSGAVAPRYVRHAYIPDRYGKEKRKQKPSAEGKLGVEGMPAEILLDALAKAGVRLDESGAEHARRQITKQDFYEDGLAGGDNSYQRRRQLCAYFDLPERLSANALIEVLNISCGYDGYKQALAELDMKKT